MRRGPITKEERELLTAIGVSVPAPTHAYGTAELRHWPDYADLGKHKLDCKCPFCAASIVFTEEGPDGDIECPHCKAPLSVTWKEIDRIVDIGVTISARITDADKKYLEWKRSPEAGAAEKGDAT